ncbi:MAG: helix-turn-helix domain-containing protein [Actinomycetales bacterium]
MPLGAYLAVAREEAGLSQAELADRVRLRTTVLMAIEDDDYSMCGGDVYARGHLKALATVLELDPQAVLAIFDEEFANPEE